MDSSYLFISLQAYGIRSYKSNVHCLFNIPSNMNLRLVFESLIREYIKTNEKNVTKNLCLVLKVDARFFVTKKINLYLSIDEDSWIVCAGHFLFKP